MWGRPSHETWDHGFTNWTFPAFTVHHQQTSIIFCLSTPIFRHCEWDGVESRKASRMELEFVVPWMWGGPSHGLSLDNISQWWLAQFPCSPRRNAGAHSCPRLSLQLGIQPSLTMEMERFRGGTWAPIILVHYVIVSCTIEIECTSWLAFSMCPVLNSIGFHPVHSLQWTNELLPIVHVVLFIIPYTHMYTHVHAFISRATCFSTA